MRTTPRAMITVARNQTVPGIEYPANSRIYWTPFDYASGATGPAWNRYENWHTYGKYSRLTSFVTHDYYTDISATKADAWYEGNSGGQTHEVATKAPNGLGLYDMSGNIWEWCYTKSDNKRIVRGGDYQSTPEFLQVGKETLVNPSAHHHNDPYSAIGFRLAINMNPKYLEPLPISPPLSSKRPSVALLSQQPVFSSTVTADIPLNGTLLHAIWEHLNQSKNYCIRVQFMLMDCFGSL